MKLASRLSALYAALLGVTVVIVILASSIALVFELWGFSRDVTVAKHEEAQILVDQYRREGMTLQQAAPDIVNALSGISATVSAGEVTCVLGDNGAGKSTLIKIIAGLHQPSSGTYEVEGTEVHFSSPREALERGIATVYQDLAVVPLMPVWRNFFLGNEVRRKMLRLNIPFMKKTCKDELAAMGIDLRDVDQAIGTLSGGERQCVAISRAVYFGAKVLILDEPTAALGVKQSGVVLKYIIQARERGLGVIFITHNPHHAYPVGDRFLLLNRGRSIGYYEKSQVTRDELTGLMAGGAELEALSHELEGAGGEVADVGRVMEEDVTELGITSQPGTDAKAT